MHGFGNRHKNNTGFGQFGAEGGRNRYRIEYGVHSNASQSHLLVQWNAQLFIGAQQFRINLIEAFRFVGHAFRRGVIRQCLEVDFRIMHICPARFFHFLPGAESF